MTCLIPGRELPIQDQRLVALEASRVLQEIEELLVALVVLEEVSASMKWPVAMALSWRLWISPSAPTFAHVIACGL